MSTVNAFRARFTGPLVLKTRPGQNRVDMTLRATSDGVVCIFTCQQEEVGVEHYVDVAISACQHIAGDPARPAYELLAYREMLGECGGTGVEEMRIRMTDWTNHAKAYSHGLATLRLRTIRTTGCASFLCAPTTFGTNYKTTLTWTHEGRV